MIAYFTDRWRPPAKLSELPCCRFFRPVPRDLVSCCNAAADARFLGTRITEEVVPGRTYPYFEPAASADSLRKLGARPRMARHSVLSGT